MMPCSLIDAASSCSASWSKSVLGWNGFVSICLTGIAETFPTGGYVVPSCFVVMSVSALSSKALRPLPSAFRLVLIGYWNKFISSLDLCQIILLQDLPCQVQVI